MSEQIDVKAKFLGGMLGTALGDAIGQLAFLRPGEEALRTKIAQLKSLTYTDDTAMAIGLAESIVHAGGRLDQQHLGDTFRANFMREPWRGYAQGPPTIFYLVQDQGMSYAEAASGLFGGVGSFGNGAAMRIAPVGLFFYDAGDLYEQARASAVVTHAHPVGIDGAALLAWAIAQAVRLNPREPFPRKDFIQGLIDFARTSEIRDKMVLVRDLLAEDIAPLEAARRLGRSVAVQESMPFALFAFLLHPESYEACLFCAVMNGGDRDTLGAMACAVSGAYLGVGAVPWFWLDKLEKRQHIEELALKLAEMKMSQVDGLLDENKEGSEEE